MDRIERRSAFVAIIAWIALGFVLLSSGPVASIMSILSLIALVLIAVMSTVMWLLVIYIRER